MNSPSIPEDPRRPLIGQAFSNAAVLVVTKILGNLIAFGFTIAIARLTLPFDRGLLATAIVLVALALMLFDVGVDPALQHFGLEPQWMTAHLTIRLGSVFALFLLTLFLILAGVIRDELAWAFLGVTISESFRVLYSTPKVIVELNYQVRKLAWAELAAMVVSAMCGVSLALAGWGWKALVAQLVILNFSQFLLGVIIARTYFNWSFDRAAIRQMITGFGPAGWIGAFFQALVGLDVLLLQRFHGTTETGYYAQAMAIVIVFGPSLTGLILRIVVPIYARNRADSKTVRHIYLLLLKSKIHFALPLFLSVAVSAPYWFSKVFGEIWHDSIVPFQLLALYMWIRLVFDDQSSITTVVEGRPFVFARVQMIYGGLFLLITGPLIWFFGATGAAGSLVVVTSMVCIGMVRLNLHVLSASLTRRYGFAVYAAMVLFTLAVAAQGSERPGAGSLGMLFATLAIVSPVLIVRDQQLVVQLLSIASETTPFVKRVSCWIISFSRKSRSETTV